MKLHRVRRRDLTPEEIARAAFIESLTLWEFFVTLTFKYEVPEHVARALLKQWLRRLAKKADDHIDYVGGLELKDGRHHWHLLLAGKNAERLTRRLIARSWRDDPKAGIADIERYERGKGAAGYVTKVSDFDPPNVACPRKSACRRGPRCTETPTSW